MTVIRPNSVSGITSITAQANEINVFRSDGALAGLQLNGVNFNTTAGVSTFATLNVTTVSIGGTLTYEDVTNVDSVGVITARSTIDAQGDVSIVDKIIHSGDTNTAIRFPSNDNISFEVGGTERLRIDDVDGVVAKHATAANLRVQNSTAATSQVAQLDLAPANGLSGVQLKATSEEDFSTGANRTAFFTVDVRKDGTFSERLRITSDGKILTPLGTTTRIGVADRISGTGAGGSLLVTAGAARGSSQTAGNLLLATGRGNNSAVSGTIMFGYNNGADGTSLDNEWLRINNSGQVLINTTTAAAFSSRKLTVSDVTSGGTTAMEIRSATNGTGRIYFTDSTSSSDAGSYAGKVYYDHNDDHMAFYTGGSTSTPSEKLRITAGGNIGVGGINGTAYSLLDGVVINTNNGSAGLIINSSSSSHNAYMSFGYGTGSSTSHNDQYSAYIGRVGDNTLILGTNNGIRATVDSTGNLSLADGNLSFASGHGIDFSATSDASGSTSELFADYERGVHTYSVTSSGTNPTVNIASAYNKLYYTKIGDMVHVTGEMRWTISSYGSGTLRISLPFAADSSANSNCQGAAQTWNVNWAWRSSYQQLFSESTPSATYLVFRIGSSNSLYEDYLQCGSTYQQTANSGYGVEYQVSLWYRTG